MLGLSGAVPICTDVVAHELKSFGKDNSSSDLARDKKHSKHKVDVPCTEGK
jgi:hypothetical protein